MKTSIKRLIGSLWLYLAAILLVPVTSISFFWGINSFFAFIQAHEGAPSMAANHVILPIVTVVFAGLAFYLREIAESLAYPIIEIAFGLATSACAGAPNLSGGELARFLALLAGIRITADGFTRFAKVVGSKKRDFSATESGQINKSR